jgi:ATP-binding cassette subfamily C protein
VGGILFFLCTLPWNIAARKMGQKMVNLNRSLHASLADKIGGIKEAKIYGAESFMERDFGAVCEALKDNVAGIAEIQTRPDFLYRLGSAFLVSLFLYVGIEVAKLSIPVLLIQVFVFARLWPLFSSFQTGFQQLVTMLPSYESFEGQIAEFRAEAETKPNSDEEIRLDESLKAVGLAFSYAGGGDFSLEGVDIELPARSFCALIGSSGAGKSTLADLLCGLLVPTGGEIFVDGKKIGVEERGQWRRSLSYVPQDPYLLHGTVRENLLAFLPEVEEQTLHECLSLAAAEFVYSLPQGLDTLVGDRGVKLSGGERQRIVLARALLRNPSFLVLDEATSALDSENDAKIQRAVTELSRRMTILVIAHRLSTVRKADAIFVVEGGKIVKKGTYASLALFESS